VKEGRLLKKEIPDFHSHFRSQFEWRPGKKITEPNELLQKEIGLARRVLSEVFRPGIVPMEWIDGKMRLVSDVQVGNRKEQALIVRFANENYIVKVTKTVGKKARAFVTVRATSGERFDIEELANAVFDTRMLPAKWEKPFYHGRLRRKSKVLRAGMWTARDTRTIDSSGEIVDADAHLPVENGPLGEGLYKRVDFYTNGRFAMFQILGGPKGGRRVESKAK
jgi:hypothetical protein